MQKRFYAILTEDERWRVVDGQDLPDKPPVKKPPTYREFWLTEPDANIHATVMNIVTEYTDGK